jgi:mycothiol synthase
MNVREHYTLRHYRPNDYQDLAQLLKAANTVLGVASSITAEELNAMIVVPDFNPGTDSFVFEDGGRVIAMSHQGFHTNSGVCWADAVVHPECRGQGIGAELIRLTEARCLEWAKKTLPPEQTVLLQLAVSDRNTGAMRLFEAHGYRVVRTFYKMQIDFADPVELTESINTPLPAGLELLPFDWTRDARAVYEADMDAFADHWGFERATFEEWSREVIDNPQTNFSLWLVAVDGDEIAGICLNRASDADNPNMAWVWLLGVRRKWRKQGLGTALLRTSFARFRQQGSKGAGLMVDSSNSTNAVGLYERAGMYVERRRLVYHKILRGAERQAPHASTETDFPDNYAKAVE